MKSLSIFKSEKTTEAIKELAKKAKDENKVNPRDEGLDEDEIEEFKNLQDFINKDPY